MLAVSFHPSLGVLYTIHRVRVRFGWFGRTWNNLVCDGTVVALPRHHYLFGESVAFCYPEEVWDLPAKTSRAIQSSPLPLQCATGLWLGTALRHTTHGNFMTQLALPWWGL